MNPYKSQIHDYIEAHREEMLEQWRTLVNLEGYFEEQENVEKVAAYLKTEFEKEGFECHIEPSPVKRAGVLVGILGKDRPNAPVLFSGHMDTVHPTGAFGPSPFRIEDGKAFGPGVLDMKGGIIIALYVAKALNHIGFDERPIKIVFAGDEEGDHEGTDFANYMGAQAQGSICAFNMETGNIENRLCVGRKTLYNVNAKIKGIGGHSGNDFAKGANAVHEAVMKTYHMIPLTDMEAGSTVTTSVLQGGDIVARIPECCTLAYDVRYATAAEGARLKKSVAEIMETTYVPGTNTEYEIVEANFPPYEETEDVLRLLNFVNRVAAENGFPEFGSIKLGGASDAGNIQRAGVPVLCSCGVTGEYNHNAKEYAVVQSLFDRTELWTLAVLSLERF